MCLDSSRIVSGFEMPFMRRMRCSLIEGLEAFHAEFGLRFNINDLAPGLPIFRESPAP